MSETDLPFAGETWHSKQTGFKVTVERVVPGVGGYAVHLTDGSMIPAWQFLKAYEPGGDG